MFSASERPSTGPSNSESSEGAAGSKFSQDKINPAAHNANSPICKLFITQIYDI